MLGGANLFAPHAHGDFFCSPCGPCGPYASGAKLFAPPISHRHCRRCESFRTLRARRFFRLPPCGLHASKRRKLFSPRLMSRQMRRIVWGCGKALDTNLEEVALLVGNRATSSRLTSLFRENTPGKSSAFGLLLNPGLYILQRLRRSHPEAICRNILIPLRARRLLLLPLRASRLEEAQAF